MPRIPVLVAATVAAVLQLAPATAADGASRVAASDGARAETRAETPEIRIGPPASGRTVSIADIERLPMHEVPGGLSMDREGTHFRGPLLADVLALIGADGEDAVTLRGADGYGARIPREDWERWPLVLATRVDGAPLGVRARGPARLLYPVHLHPELDDRIYIDRSVWLIAEIEW
ncbi:molybdopterin-dependent oxidoreductase [Salinarimonas chemoclinalis]|uniref:molybdopterin-dependent oxidoreductase n=1 Tax=Salinarimonas chemoclinalis TaxID=3241599 RepID=UPI003558FE36